ncbi:MAG: hypothetical protein ABR562_04550 [Thermoplasmatota archaeon]
MRATLAVQADVVADGVMRCYTCHGQGAIHADVPFDTVADRAQWPDLDCFFTPGCTGTIVPEALN